MAELVVGTNTYLSLEDAETYFDGSLNSGAWDSADETIKIKALISAARAIDRQILKGEKYDTDQAMAFPRYIATGDVGDGSQEAKDAQCEEAIERIRRERSNRMQNIRAGVRTFSIGGPSGLQEELDPAAIRGILSPEARELLRPYLGGSVPITSSRTRRI